MSFNNFLLFGINALILSTTLSAIEVEETSGILSEYRTSK